MSKAEFEFDVPASLPDGWKWTPLEELMDQPKQDIVDGPFGSNLKASEYVEDGIPIARLQNVDRNTFVHKNIKYLTRQKAEKLSRHTFKPEDILITKLGDPLGEACIAPSSIEHGVIVADLVRVRPAESKVVRRYLMYAINSPLVARQFEKHTKGTTRPRVNLGMIRKLPIPVAPREMQAGVVAEIEKQFSRLDEAVANLKRVKANLKRYKAAVLKAAVEGRLVETEAEIARREGRSYETGAQLLQRILETRRSRWQGKGKYKEPAAPDSTDLPELPEGWVWCSGAQLFEWSSGEGLTEKSQRTGPYPIYGGNGISGHHDEYFVEEPTLVVGRVGAHCGNVYVTKSKCWITDNAIYAKSFPNDEPLEYLQIVFTQAGLNRIAAGSGQPFVNQRMLNEVSIPLPPLDEQLRIVKEVDRRLSLLRETEAQVNANLQRAERLRQSILYASFSTGI
jgi:type I restriction enzyme S subunit